MMKLLVLSIILQMAYIHGFEIRPRIVNGLSSKPEAFPFYVHLKTFDKFFGDFGGCGGTILTNRWILTAAHCLDGESDITVYAEMEADDEYKQVIRVPLENQFVHYAYDPKADSNDIALIKLPHAIEYTPGSQPAKLPTDCGNDLENIEVTALGTGRTSFFHHDWETGLRHVHLHTLTSTECKDQSRHSAEPNAIMCTISDNGETTNSGDSGGPLLRRSDNTFIGVISFLRYKRWHLFCIRPVKLQGFTKVHYHFDWISQITGLELPKC